MPVHCTAGGKLLLAFASAELKKHVLRSAPFRANTKKTITNGRTFARELEKIRQRGFAEDDQELFPGVNCLAVPIRNRAGEVVAGLAVMAPAAMLPLEKIRSHLPEIRKCAAIISEELGWAGRVPAVAKTTAGSPRRGTRKGRIQSAKRGPARLKRHTHIPRSLSGTKLGPKVEKFETWLR